MHSKEETGGNIYNKYTTGNPIVRLLMSDFFRHLDALLENVNPRRVLDVGCGEGYISQHIKEKYPETHVEGVDFSPGILEVARELNPDIMFLEGNIYSLEYEDYLFDLVIACEVLEHLDKPEDAIKELKRVSSRYVILSVPNEPFFRIANILRFRYLRRLGNTPGHLNNWTRKEFSDILQKNFREFKHEISTIWQIALCVK